MRAFAPRITRLLALITTLIAAVGRASAAEPGAPFDAPIALIGAKIIPVAGEPIERGTIVIERGRITAVGADIDVPAAADRLDCDGLVIYPGFIDANTHAGVDGTVAETEQKRVEGESPDERDGPQSETVEAYRRLVHPSWRVETRVDPASGDLAGLRRTGFTAALVSPPPAIAAGLSAVVQLGELPLRRQFVKTEFAQHAAFVTGMSFGGFGGGGFGQQRMRYPSTTMGAMALFRQVMLDAEWNEAMKAWAARHAQEADRLPHDADLQALSRVRAEGTPVVFDADGENEIHRALDMAKEFGLRPIICGGTEAWRVIDRLKAENVPLIVSLRWDEEPRKPKSLPKGEWHPALIDAKGPLFDEAWQDQAFEPKRAIDERTRLWEEQIDNCKRLHEAGIAFAIGSFGNRAARDVFENVRKAIERGLPEDAAIRALTINTARLLGVEQQLGTIEPGRLANLTILTKPLADKQSKVKWVFIDGRRYDDESGSGRGGGGGGGFGRRGGRRGQGPPGERPETRDPREEETPEEEQVSTQPSEPAAVPPPSTQPVPAASQPESEVVSDEPRRPGRGRRGRWRDRAAADAAQGQATSMPTTTSAPAEPERYPEWPVETLADRHPAFKTGGNILFKNGTILTVTKGRLEKTDVLVRDGKIAAIGRSLSAGGDVKIVDVTGYVVCPGIIDAHSHMATDGGLNEGTLSVTPEVRIGDVLDQRDASLYRALAGGVTSVHTMHGSANSIGGQCATIKLRYDASAAAMKFAGAPRTVKWALGENVSQRGSGPNRGTRFPNTRMGVVATIRRSLDAARRYADEWKAYESAKKKGEDPRPVRRDLRLDALRDILDGKLWVHCHCYRSDEILQLLKTAEDFGFRIGVLQHVLEGYRLIPEILRHGCGASTFSDWWAYKLEAYDAIPHNAARMTQGGIVSTVNSDSAEVVRHLNVEAAKSLAFGGLDETAALRLITINAAIQLGVSDRVGSLEVGKDADIAIFDGHPLDTFSRCVMTLVDGEARFVHPSFDPAAPTAAGRPIIEIRPAPQDTPALPPPAAAYALVAATVHPVSGPSIDNGTVLMRNGRIDRVLTSRDVAGPALEGAMVVRVEGLHVYPGLINASTSLGLTEIGQVQASIDSSEIGRYQPDLTAAWGLHPHSELLGVARAAGLTTAVMIPGGGTIAGQAALLHLAGWTEPEMVIDPSLALCVSLPSMASESPRFRRAEAPGGGRSEQIRENVQQIREIERYFQRARQYSDLCAAAEAGTGAWPRRDSRWDAMRPYVRGDKPVIFSADSYKQILEALIFAKRVNVQPVINGGRDASKLANRLAAESVGVIIHGATAYPDRSFGTFDSGYRNAAVLDNAGVSFCIAAPSASNARQLGVEAGMAVAHGLDPDRAVHAITLGAAQVLGIDADRGSIDAGKRGDLIVTTGHPGQASTRVLYMFIEGAPVSLESRHTILDEKFRGRPKPTLAPNPTLAGPTPMRLGAAIEGAHAEASK